MIINFFRATLYFMVAEMVFLNVVSSPDDKIWGIINVITTAMCVSMGVSILIEGHLKRDKK